MSAEKPESAAVSVPNPKAREIAVRIVRIALADFQNKHIPSNEVEERAIGWGFANIQSALDAARDEQREKDATIVETLLDCSQPSVCTPPDAENPYRCIVHTAVDEIRGRR